MSVAKQRTTIYLPEELRWELRRVMAERHVDSDTKAVEEAVRQWINTKQGATPQLVVSNKDPWLRALATIMASGDRDAISAVQQNIVIFFKHIGGNPEELPLVAAPPRGFLRTDGTTDSSKPAKKRA